jgi:hypothetical protein
VQAIIPEWILQQPSLIFPDLFPFR